LIVIDSIELRFWKTTREIFLRFLVTDGRKVLKLGQAVKLGRLDRRDFYSFQYLSLLLIIYLSTE
jgi:hypothetical protein